MNFFLRLSPYMQRISYIHMHTTNFRNFHRLTTVLMALEKFRSQDAYYYATIDITANDFMAARRLGSDSVFGIRICF